MKKIMISVLGAALLASCGGKNPKSVDSDSIAEADIMEVVEAVAGSSIITSDSIGAIHIGMATNELPDSVAGLYSSKHLGTNPDAVTTEFVDSDGVSFVAYDFGEGNVDVLTVSGPNVKVAGPESLFGLGDSFMTVLSLPGIEPEWSGYDDNGMWYWKWEGLWFAPDPSTLTAPLSRKLYHSGDAPAEVDFSEDVRIGFIGTGLPF